MNYEFQPQIDASETISDLEKCFKARLPDDYRRFVSMAASFHGFIGRSYLVLSSLDEAIEEEALFRRADRLPGFVAIGNDGGQELFVLDTRSEPAPVVMLPRISPHWEDAIPVAPSFGELFLALLAEADDRALPPIPPPNLGDPEASLVFRDAATPEALIRIGALFDSGAPSDYVRFLSMSDGAIGQVGEEDLSVWPTEDVVRRREAGEFAHTSRLVVFGDDGAGTFYGFDLADRMTIVSFRSHADAAAPQPVAASFGELFLALFARKDGLTLPTT